MSEQELKHYGVKGMKWGVRRYRKNAGSYTAKGLKKFDSSVDKYDSAKNKLKGSKESGDKTRIKSDKQAVKLAKAQLKKDYKQIKKDRLADQGRELYQRGKTITDNTARNTRNQVAVVVGARVANVLLSNYANTQVGRMASATIGIGGTFVNLMLAQKTASENKKLRAYYAHTR